MEILNLALTKALGMALFHSIWQGTLIALVMSILLSLVRRKHAKTRYIVSLSALFVMLILFVSTFIHFYDTNIPVISEVIGPPNGVELNDIVILANEYGWLFHMKEFFLHNIQWISFAWAIGMLLFVTKVVFGLRFTGNVKISSREIEISWIEKILDHLKDKAKFGRIISLRESLKINSPSVIGFLKPCIYFPIGLVNNLSETEAEAILAHELAHIIRNDYLVNIMQSFVESIFYFHPAVWWISANIRIEREHACDDLAVRIIGDKLRYAKSLVYLQEWEKLAAPSLAMSFSNNETPLFARIKRILNQPKNKHDMKQKIFASIILLSSIIWISATDANQQVDDLVQVEDLEMEYNLPSFADSEVLLVKDTLPAQIMESKSTIIELKNGKIKRLEIDGVEIPENEFEEHQSLVEELQVERLPELSSNHFYVYPHNEDIEMLLERSQEHLDDFMAEIEVNRASLEPYLENKFEHIYELSDEMTERLQHQSQELESIYEGLGEDFHINKNYYYEYNDSLKNRLDSFKFRMGDFNFDFDDMASDIRIFVDSFDFPQLADDVFVYLDSFDFKSIGDDIRIHMDSFHFPEFDSHYDFRFGSNLESAYLRALKDDDLYDKNGNDINLSFDKLEINGNVQSEDMLEKYKSIYERKTGTKLLNGSNIHIELDNSSNNNNFKRI